MLRRVKLKNGDIVEFPNSYGDADIRSYLLKTYDASELADEDAGMVRGTADFAARGGGLLLDTIGGAADLAQTDAAAPIFDEGTVLGDSERAIRKIPLIGRAANQAARLVETAESTAAAVGRGAAGLVRDYGPDALKPFAGVVDVGANEIQRGQLERRTAENQARADRGEQSLESETGGTFAQAFADQAREMGDRARDSVSAENKIEQAQVADAFDRGIGTGFGYVASNPLDTFNAFGPELAAFIVGGGIAGRTAKGLGLADEAAAAISVQGQGAAAAEMNASGAADAAKSLTDDQVLASPMGMSLVEGGMTIAQARDEMSRRAYDAAFGVALPTNAALMFAGQKLNLNPVDNVVAGAPGFAGKVASATGAKGRFGRAVSAGGAEAVSEGIEEGADQLAQNIGEVGGGARRGEDVLEGVGTAAAMGAAIGAPLGGGLGLFTSPLKAAEAVTAEPTDKADPVAQGFDNVRRIYANEVNREAGLPTEDLSGLVPPSQATGTPPAADATLPPTGAAPAATATLQPPPAAPAPLIGGTTSADPLEAGLTAAGAAPVIQPGASATDRAAFDALAQQQTAAGQTPPTSLQSRAYEKPELQDAPNFAMPEMERTLPDDSPLLRPHWDPDKPELQDNSPERVAIRERLMAQRLDGKPSVPAGQKPVVFLMGGGGASGKGTVLKQLSADGTIDLENSVYIDPDSYKTGDADFGFDGIPEYAQIIGAGDKRGATVVHEESSKLTKDTVARAMKARNNIVIDSTLGNAEKAAKMINDMKAAGYEVRLVGVTVDPREAVIRSVERSKGPHGRYVPLQELLKAHKGFSAAFDMLQSLVDSAMLFDNNVARDTPARLIAQRRQGGSTLDVADKVSYDLFAEKAKINDKATTYKEIGYGNQVSQQSRGRGDAGPRQSREPEAVRPGELEAGTRGTPGAGEPAAAPAAAAAETRDAVTETAPEQAPDQAPKLEALIEGVITALGLSSDMVTIVRTPADLPKGVSSRGLDGKTEGIYDPDTGKVFLFSDALISPSRAIWVTLHELAGHKGLRALLPQELFAKTMQEAGTNPTIRGIANAIMAEAKAEADSGTAGARPTTDPTLFLEEALAEFTAAYISGDYDSLMARYGESIEKQQAFAATAQEAANAGARLKAQMSESARRAAEGVVKRLIRNIKSRLFNIRPKAEAGVEPVRIGMSDSEIAGLITNAYVALRDGKQGGAEPGAAVQSRAAGESPTEPSPDLPKLLFGKDVPPKDKPVVLMFGGSFNPVHNGHVQSALDARQMMIDAGYTVERVIISPTGQKLLQAKLGDKAMPISDRTEIARLMFEGIDGFEVSDGPAIEADNFVGKLKRTQLANWAKSRYENASVVNIAGADTVAGTGSPPGIPSVYAGDPGTSHEGYYYLAVPREEEGEGSLSSSKVRKSVADGKGVPAGFMNAAAEARYLEMVEGGSQLQSRGESANIVALKKGEEKAPKLKGKTEVATFLQERAIKKRGRVLEIKDEADRDLIADDMVTEAIFEMENPQSAFEWYDQTIKKTMGMLALKFPEIETEQDARTSFAIALAITSQNMAVPDNLSAAAKVYGEYRKTGRFPILGFGSKGGSMKKNFTVANKLLERFKSVAAMRSFLETPMTVRQLNALGIKKIGGELIDAEVLGSSVFGPKIGFGFYSNLTGNFDPVTMDMWFMRTIGRLSGKILAMDPLKFGRQLDKLRAALDTPDATSAELIKQATKLKAAHEKDFKVNRALYDSGERTKSAATNAAINVVKSLKDTRDAPSSGEERRLLRDIVDRALAKMKERTGQDVPPASFQALIWYPEQDLFKDLGVKLKHVRQDYANSTKNFLLGEGFNEAELDEAAGRAIRQEPDRLGSGSGTARRGDGRQDGRGVGRDGGRSGKGASGQEQSGDGRAIRGLPGAGRSAARQDAGAERQPAVQSRRLPDAPVIRGFDGPDPRLVSVAEQYARDNGIPLRRQSEYVKVDPARAKRIADAYEAMQHAPQDPAVAEAYADLIEQTVAQYRALEAAGYRFWFIDIASDAGQEYSSTPWNALRDIRANQQMGVFPTLEGFGSDDTLNVEDNPLLGDTGIEWPFGGPDGELKPVLANDLFRAVHDAFGHGLEGAGFRADGEENAWQAHVRLFTGPAVRAITSETRGQNSWLNYGPNGETNRTATVEDTVFADQKTGLMPEWTSTEGRAGDMPLQSRAPKTKEFREWFRDSRVVDANGEPLRVFHGTKKDFDVFKVGSREPGVFFTPSPLATEPYSMGLGVGAGGRTVPAYLRITNPYEMTKDDLQSLQLDQDDIYGGMKGYVKELKAAGYDGIYAPADEYDGGPDWDERYHDVWIAFDPNQIKSVFNDKPASSPNILQSRPAKDARAAAAELRTRKSQLAKDLTSNMVTAEQVKAWTSRARVLIGEVSTSRDFAQDLIDAKRMLTPERREALQGDREALKRYDAVRDMIAIAEEGMATLRTKQAEANRLLDKTERRESIMSLADREALVEELAVALDSAEMAYIAAKRVADWRSANDYKIIKAHKKRGDMLDFLAAEGYQQGSFLWASNGLKDLSAKVKRYWRRALQDRMIDMRDVQEEIERQLGRSLDDLQNVYRLENLMHGKTADRMERYRKGLVQPLKDLIAASGMTQDMVDKYLWAKHAKERNDKIRSIRPDVEDGSGMTYDEAKTQLASYTPEQTAKLERIGHQVERIRKHSIETLVESGQITREAADAILGSYKNYVPLRGKDGDGEERIGGRGTGQGISSGAVGIQRALGRKTPPKNILAELVGDGERAIVQAGKAEVGRALLRLVLSYPNPDLWSIEPVILTPKFSEATGEAYLSIGTPDDAETIIVKHNGKPYKVQIKHARLADALKNAGAGGSEWVVKYIGSLNRWLSAVFTRFNPGFVPVNLARDMLQGASGLYSELGGKSATAIMLSWHQAVGASWKDARGNQGDSSVPDADKTMLDWTREFAEVGGKTGFSALDNMDTLQQNIEDSMLPWADLMKKHKGNPFPIMSQVFERGPVISQTVQFIEDANDVTENALRIATYAHLRKEKGWSKDRAATYAKEMTVNFNRKGTYGSVVNSLFLFFNAAVQGSRRTLMLMNQPKVRGILGGLMAGQAAMVLALGMQTLDDDDETLWEKIPDHAKRRGFIIPMGFDKDGTARYISIPMPFGFNIFPAAGGYMSNYFNPHWRGKMGSDPMKHGTEMMAYVTSTAIDAVSPMPVGEEGWFQPTIVRMYTNIERNKDDLGRRIRPSDAFSEFDMPRADMYTPGTPESLVLVAKMLNRIGGGSDLTPPKLFPSFTDVSPNDLEYLIGQLTGGPGTTLLQAQRAATRQVALGDMAAFDIPVVRAVVGGVRPEQREAARFYDNKDTIERNLERMKRGYMDGGVAGMEAVQDELGPAYDDIGIRVRKRTTENGRAGEILTDKNTGRPQFVAEEGSMLAEYREAERELRSISAAMRAIYNDRSLGSVERQRQLVEAQRKREEKVRDLNRMMSRINAQQGRD